MLWYEVHYRIGEMWHVCREECGTNGRFPYETFARRRAQTIMDCGWAVEAMVVRVIEAQYSLIKTREVNKWTEFTVVLPVLV